MNITMKCLYYRAWEASSQDICRGIFIDEPCACVARSVGLQVCGGEWHSEGVGMGGPGGYTWGQFCL